MSELCRFVILETCLFVLAVAYTASARMYLARLPQRVRK